MKSSFRDNQLNELYKKHNKGNVLVLMLLFVVLLNIYPFITISKADENNTKTITVTKVWQNDEESVRPDNITVYIKTTSAQLITGTALEAKMKSLAGNGGTNLNNTTITAIKKASKGQYEAKKSSLTSNNEVQSSGEKVYMWYDGGTIYFYSEASTIYMNANSTGTFRKMRNLTDISGLEYFNTSYVTDMNRIFQDSTKIADFSPISGWDVGYVTTFEFSFGSNNPGTDPFQPDNMNAFKDWDVSNVTNFNQAFKGWKNVTTLEPIKDWDVSKVTTFNQAFNWFVSLTDDTRDYIKDWDVSRVSNFANMFNNAGAITKPIFTNRPGTWGASNGSYIPNANAQPALTPTSPPAMPPTTIQYTNSSSNCTLTKNGSIWTYEFTVTDDNSKYSVWEDVPADYTSTATSSNPITDVTNSATITNTNTKRREITVTKVWDDDIDSSQRPSSVKVHLKKDGTTTEKLSEDSGWTQNGDGTWTYKFYVYDTDNYSVYEEDVICYTSDAPSSSPRGVISDAATITNSLNKYNIILKDQVTGNLADTNKRFTFNISIYKQDNTDVTGDFLSNRTVELKHGEQVIISGIPQGYKYSIQETSTDYTESYKIEKTDDNSEIEGQTSGIKAERTLTENQTVTFINDKTDTVQTGINVDINPYIVLSLGAIVLIFITKITNRYL